MCSVSVSLISGYFKNNNYNIATTFKFTNLTAAILFINFINKMSAISTYIWLK